MYTPCGDVYVRSHTRMCVRVYACLISGLKHPLRIFSNQLDAYTLDIHQNPQFMSCETIYVFLVASDMARRDTSNCAI